MAAINFELHKIFVEGSTDQEFIQFILEEKFGISLDVEQTKNAIINCNGWTNITKKSSILQNRMRVENGGKNLIIFDADSKSNGGGFEKRKKQLEKIALDLKVSFEIFLFPNDSDSGDLEEFYCSCFKNEFKFFNECWNSMINCFVQNQNGYSLKYPKADGKVFSYVDLFEQYKKDDYPNKKTKRHYFDSGLWEFDFANNEKLKKVTNFIERHIVNN